MTNNNKKTKKSEKEFNVNIRCSPKKKNNDYTCYSDNSLLKLRNYWNIRHPDKRINREEPREIWDKLKKNMSNVCEVESCWLRQKFIKENLDKDLLNFTFAPKSPEEWKKNPSEWLSSIDIENVMKQYEHAYPSFQFIGPTPIDFDTLTLYDQCVWEELCKFDLYTQINNGKTKIAIVFNTDPHYKGGSHWIALFINIQKKYIYYFDSNGNPPPNEINKFIERVDTQGQNLGIKFNIMSNYPFEHQMQDSECGMYVLYFIIEVLTNRKQPDYFNKNRITDEEMNKLRKKYFNEDL